MATFGHLVRYYRRQCVDPLRGGLLTQERLGELIGHELGDAGYSGAAVSDWERDKSKIGVADRLVLISLLTVLQKYGGLEEPEKANQILQAGNYRSLDQAELSKVFPGLSQRPTAVEPLASAPRSASGPTGSAEQSQATPVALTRDRQKQLILLEKVEAFWVEGVLHTSIADNPLLALEYEDRAELIRQPWATILGPDLLDSKPTTTVKTIAAAFAQSDHSLLILGEPGSGKTMTLISLAADLIEQARHNPDEPIPVILSLASWPEQSLAISRWVEAELTAKYQIPRQVGQRWLAEDRLILLLDSYDEVPIIRRADCAQKINQFLQQRGLTGMAICCRSEEYMSTGIALELSLAIELQPLNDKQLFDYLAAAGFQLTALRSAIHQDDNLKELARSPLMLNVMTKAYSYSQEDLSGVLENLEDKSEGHIGFWQQRLFATYVQRMFGRRPAQKKYPPEETHSWLGWLAGQMFANNRSQFLIEQLQPNWLPSRSWRWYYLLIVGFLTGVGGGIFMWVLLQILRESDPQLPAPLSNQFARLLQIAQGRAEVVTLLAANICLGLVVALFQGRYYERLFLEGAESESRGWRYQWHLILIGLVVGALTIATVTFVGNVQLALIWATAEIVLYMAAARFIFGRSYRHEIRVVEALSWSWSSAAKGFAIGLLLAAITESIGILFYDSPATINSSTILGAAGFVLGGLRGRRLEKKNRPNQGVYLSLRNSFIAAILSGVTIGLIAWLFRDLKYGLLTGGLVFFTAGALVGGSNAIKHFLIRAMLWRNGDLPWRYADFLDYAAGLALLRKVGGSYIFIHRLLQQYFAHHYAISKKPGQAIYNQEMDLKSQPVKSEGA